MRTTVSIDDEVYETARRIAFESRRTLGSVINELIVAGLRATSAPSGTRQLGALRSAVWIADDFDDTPPEVIEALDRPI